MRVMRKRRKPGVTLLKDMLDLLRDDEAPVRPVAPPLSDDEIRDALTVLDRRLDALERMVRARTPLGERLAEIRSRIEAGGGRLLSWEELGMGPGDGL